MQWDERIGRRLKLRDLHIFMTVASRAAWGERRSISRFRSQ
jgi:hypothetical protein